MIETCSLSFDTSASRVEICGVVLAGGLSSRLGYDKAAINLEGEENTTLLNKTADLLCKVAGNVVISGRFDAQYPSVQDSIKGSGPLAGISSALQWLNGKAALVCSCDLPFMTEAILQKLVEVRRSRPKGTLVTAYKHAETGQVETLAAIYEPEALPFLNTSLQEKKYKLKKIIPEQQQLLIPYVTKEALPFFNINYPADLEVAKRLLSFMHSNIL